MWCAQQQQQHNLPKELYKRGLFVHKFQKKVTSVDAKRAWP